MKKLIIGAAITAALFTTGANATITIGAGGKPTITPADTYQVYLSGASAPRQFIEQLLTNTKVPAANRLCDSTQTIYRYQNAGNGTDQNAYLCVINPLNPTLNALTSGANGKANLLIYKRSLGGSALGVNPVIDDVAIDFLKVDDPSICSAPTGAGTVQTLTCNFVEGDPNQSNSQKPDFGVSDLDPLQFQGVNTPSGFSAVTPADVAKLTIKPAAAQVFGVVVNTTLRNALQDAQFPLSNSCNPSNAGYAAAKETARCMPTISSGILASIFTGKFTSWNQIKIGTSGDLFTGAPAALRPPSNRIHICRRTNGSGTGAQFGVKFLNYPCAGSVATPPKPDTGALPEGVNQTQVHQMGSSGQLAECLSELDNGSNTIGTSFNNTYGRRWAIGIQGTENNASLTGPTSAYRFVRVDGYTPTGFNVVKGVYKDWVELTYQYNNTHAFDPNELAIVNEVITQSGNPTVMAVTNDPAANHVWGLAGFLAVPQNFPAFAGGVYGANSPRNPLSHGTTADAPNACRAPTLYGTGGLQTK
jgi:hypothetical protein